MLKVGVFRLAASHHERPASEGRDAHEPHGDSAVARPDELVDLVNGVGPREGPCAHAHYQRCVVRV